MKKIYLAALLTASCVTAFAMNPEDRNNNNNLNSSNLQQVQKIKREKFSPYRGKDNPTYELSGIINILEIHTNQNYRSLNDLMQAYVNLSQLLGPEAYDFILDNCGDDIAIQNSVKPFNLKGKEASKFIYTAGHIQDKEVLWRIVDLCKRFQGAEELQNNDGEAFLKAFLLELLSSCEQVEDKKTLDLILTQAKKFQLTISDLPNFILHYSSILENNTSNFLSERAENFGMKDKFLQDFLSMCSYDTEERLKEIFDKCEKTLNISLNISKELALRVIYACIHATKYNPEQDLDAFIDLFFDLQNKGTLELIVNAWYGQFAVTNTYFTFEEGNFYNDSIFTFINTCNTFADQNMLEMTLAKIKELQVPMDSLIGFAKVCQGMPNKEELALFLESCNQVPAEDLFEYLKAVAEKLNIHLI